MIGLLLVSISTLAEEIRDSLGKYEVSHHLSNIYALGFLTSVWGLITILAIGFLAPKDFLAPGFPAGFIFSPASLPTLLPRLLLELFQVHITLRALVEADRSTFGFLRTLTLPLLFAVDILLGYHIGFLQVVGLSAIIGSLFILFVNHGLNTRGSGLVLLGAVNAVSTISLFKYNITNFNSVETEQAISFAFLTVILLCVVIAKGQNPLRLASRPLSVLHILLSGAGSVVFGFALAFAPASVITAAKRSLSVLWALVSGHAYFEEHHVVLKLVCFVLVSTGIVLLVV